MDRAPIFWPRTAWSSTVPNGSPPSRHSPTGWVGEAKAGGAHSTKGTNS